MVVWIGKREKEMNQIEVYKVVHCENRGDSGPKKNRCSYSNTLNYFFNSLIEPPGVFLIIIHSELTLCGKLLG